jgi:hypothetical protein
MSDTAENLCVIFFDLHSTTAAVSQLSLSEFVVDESHVEGQACGQTFENRYESASVRFSCCGEAKHMCPQILDTISGLQDKNNNLKGKPKLPDQPLLA